MTLEKLNELMNHPALVWCWLAFLLGLAICLAIGGWLAMGDDDDNTR